MKAMGSINLPLKKDLKIVLLGSGQHLCYLAESLVKRKFCPPVIVTHPRQQHARDKALLGKFNLYGDVFEVARKYSLKIIESETVNKTELIEQLREMGVNVAFSLSCRSIIKPDFINAFGRRVLNIHPTFLPLGRGGGTFSWRIMNDIREVAATIHMVDEGIDSGDILFQQRRNLTRDDLYPVDYLRETQKEYEALLDKFLDAIERDQEFKLIPQDHAKSTYLPRLYTELNGAIDWGWKAGEIERFIRAFGEPYPGAFTFIDGELINILKVGLELDGEPSHPYISGTIQTVLNDGTVRVIAKNGILVVKEVIFKNKIFRPSEICKAGQRFFTSPDTLVRAKTQIPKVKNMCDTPEAFLGEVVR